MASIGHVTANKNGGFKGQLKTLSLTADIEIVPNEHKAHENQPEYRVISAGIEVGAGWNRRSETTGRDYVSLSLAAPEFGPRPDDGRVLEPSQHEVPLQAHEESAQGLLVLVVHRQADHVAEARRTHGDSGHGLRTR